MNRHPPKKSSDDSSKPAIDFLDLLRARASRIKAKVPGGRTDWEKTYPGLLSWDGVVKARSLIHAEVTLALNVLLDETSAAGEKYFSISKQPCFLCETWFDKLSSSITSTTFFIPEGHKKLYEGWLFSGIDSVDERVVAQVWEKFDQLSASIRYIERNDTVIPVYKRETSEGEIDLDEIEGMKEKLKMMRDKW